MSDHPETKQILDSQVQSEGLEVVSDELEREIRDLAFDPRFFFKHYYQEGDYAFVNNYTVLHGREAFSGSRELWRLQAIPPTDNVPKYFLDQNNN